MEAFVAPSTDTVNAVNEWLSSQGVQATTLSPAGDWLSLSVDVDKANQMFDADFSVFTHESTGEQTIRTLSYSVPAALKDHVELVHPTVAYVTPVVFIPESTHYAVSPLIPEGYLLCLRLRWFLPLRP